MNIQDSFPFRLTRLIFLQSKGLLQHYSSKASILWCSAFFMVQFSHPYMTTGKTKALTIQTFVGKVMSLIFNRLSTFVIAFLARSRCLNFMVAVTIHSVFGAQENKIIMIITIYWACTLCQALGLHTLSHLMSWPGDKVCHKSAPHLPGKLPNQES